jgi:beta-galactosidase
VTVDVVAPGADLAGYRLVVVPCLYLVSDAAASVIDEYAASGGHVVVTFFSGIVDEDDRVRLGGYPGAFRDLLGVTTEEFAPLLPGDAVALDDGTDAGIWTERMRTTTAEAVVLFAGGQLAGGPAVTRNAYGSGVAWYIGAGLDAGSITARLSVAAAEAGVVPTRESGDASLEVVRRRSESAEYLFLINHGQDEIGYPASGAELVTATEVSGTIEIPGGAVRVIRMDLSV